MNHEPSRKNPKPMNHEKITNELQDAVAIADGYRFGAEYERCREVRSFYELRGLHRRGQIGDCAMTTAFCNAIKATQNRTYEQPLHDYEAEREYPFTEDINDMNPMCGFWGKGEY